MANSLAVPLELNLPDRSDTEEEKVTIDELMHVFDSFMAVFWPVSLTIIFAALSIVYINDGLNGKSDGSSSTGGLPTIYAESADDSGVEQAGKAVVNALVYIGVIMGVTFVMVTLYYFNCIKILIGWLLLSTGSLLFFTTSFVVLTAFEIYHVVFDVITWYFFFWNFAVVGLVAIFYQKGIPMVVTQSYLVIVSSVMAWILVRILPQWTTWAFLVLLAVYDLCAVLTPCGPLKCLVEMAQDREDPLPGLLYEAKLKEKAVASSNDVEISTTNEYDEVSALEPSRDQAQHMVSDFAERSSIKLGLGDFVFYSVLGGKAALNGFSTFIAVYISIMTGLGSTLFLLAVYRKALPALPISIFLGVGFYFITEVFVTPAVNYLALSFIII